MYRQIPLAQPIPLGYRFPKDLSGFDCQFVSFRISGFGVFDIPEFLARLTPSRATRFSRIPPTPARVVVDHRPSGSIPADRCALALSRFVYTGNQFAPNVMQSVQWANRHCVGDLERTLADHGTTTRLRTCTAGPGGRACAPCRAAGTAARRRQRSRKPDAVPTGSAKVTVLHTSPQQQIKQTENESAVRAQCANSKLAEDKPGTVSQAVTLAKILDDPDLQPIHAQTSRQLHALLTSLDAPKRKMKGSHLAMVSAMAGRQGRRVN
jgi:hypothetical protein